MKSLEELDAIRDKMKHVANTRRAAHAARRVAVAMSTCGIGAGARDVLNAFTEAVAAAEGLEDVMVTQTGCIGLCPQEPVAQVILDGQTTTYVSLTPDKARRIVKEHLQGGKPVDEYAIGK